MQPQLGIWKRFFPRLLVEDRILFGRQMKPQLKIWKRFIISLISGGQMQPQLGI